MVRSSHLEPPLCIFGSLRNHLLLTACLPCHTPSPLPLPAHNHLSYPLGVVESISSPTLHILPRDPNNPSTLRRRSSNITPNPSYAHPHRTLEPEDSFRLRFTAYNSTFSLHLVPNLELFHPDATLTIVSEDGDETISKLDHDDFRIYRGVVVDETVTERRLMEDTVGVSPTSRFKPSFLPIFPNPLPSADSSHPVFEGAFSHNQDIYHIKTVHTFRLTRRSDDPDPFHLDRKSPHTSMFIYRDSDQLDNPYGSSSHHRRRSFDEPPHATECGADDLRFNTHISNPARSLRRERLGAIPAASPFGYAGLGRRVGDLDENWEFEYANRGPASAAAKFVKRAVNTTGCPTG
ncbi:hypothetical protein BC938DRAFT_473965, partial [Jimgerdemannia flammicorona]